MIKIDLTKKTGKIEGFGEEQKGNPYDSLTGKSNHYRKENESWDICDYRHWGEPIWREISS